MTLENLDKIKLFETVLAINDREGDVKLTSSDRALIEKETRALLNAAISKKAAKAPEGWDEFLRKLQTFENADDAYQMVLEFINKDKGKDLGKPDLKPEIKPELGKGLEKGLGKEEKPEGLEGLKPEPKPDLKDLGEKKPDLGHDLHELKESPKEELEEHKKDLKPEVKESPKEEIKEHKPEDLKKEKGLGEKGPMGKGLEKGKEEKLPFKVKDPKSAARVQVKITSSRNIIAYLDGKPIFHANPKSSVKDDVEALNRLANKVYGWIIYEGIETAAKKCSSRLLVAGIDDNIEVVTEEKPGKSDSIVSEADDVIADEVHEKPVKDSGEGAEDVIASKEAGIDEGVEVVTEEKPPEKPESITSDAEDVIEEKTQEKPVKDSGEGAEDVIASKESLEDSFKKLYASRAKKLAKEANDKFVQKFIRAMKIAERRMALNYEANPLKAACFDVLTESGMDPEIASDLTEQISVLGQKEFFDQVLDRTASLMIKSEDYLKDIEQDLGVLNAKPVEVVASEKNSKVKKEIEAGNFGLKTGSKAAASDVSNDWEKSIRSAVGSTSVGILSKNASARFGR